MRKLQIVWTGVVPANNLKINVIECINIIDTVVTPLNSVDRGLQLLTSSGDIVLPCSECVSKKITENISYGNMNIISKGNTLELNVVVYVLCNGCIGHESENEYSIAFYIDTK
jgi:hypothetical protein